MELSLPLTLYLFNIFRKYDEKETCAQVLAEYVYKMFDTKSLNDQHDCNVVSTNSLNIHSTNDDCASCDENFSYRRVDFCGVHWVFKYTPNREIDIARGISIQKLNGCKKGLMLVLKI